MGLRDDGLPSWRGDSGRTHVGPGARARCGPPSGGRAGVGAGWGVPERSAGTRGDRREEVPEAPYRLLARVEPMIERFLRVIEAGTERLAPSSSSSALPTRLAKACARSAESARVLGRQLRRGGPESLGKPASAQAARPAGGDGPAGSPRPHLRERPLPSPLRLRASLRSSSRGRRRFLGRDTPPPGRQAVSDFYLDSVSATLASFPASTWTRSRAPLKPSFVAFTS